MNDEMKGCWGCLLLIAAAALLAAGIGALLKTGLLDWLS